MAMANRNNAATSESASNQTVAASARGAGAPPPMFAIDPFDKTKSKWMRWVERLKNAFVIYGISDELMQKNLLLHHMGSDTYDVICDKIAPDVPSGKTFNEIVDTLDAYFNPQPLEISENFRFKCRRQGDKNAASPDESIDEYLIALRRISVTCNFGAYLDTALRNQLVFGIKRNDVRSRLLERRNLTLQEARDIAVSMELSKKGGAEMEGCFSQHEVHTMQKGKEFSNEIKSKGKSFTSLGQGSKELSCFRCGAKTHLANSCKHKVTVCSFCKVKGHLAKVCMKKNSVYKNDTARKNVRPSKVQTNYLTQLEKSVNENASEASEICTVDTDLKNSRYWLSVQVNGKCIKFEIDTGSPVSILSAKCYYKLFPREPLRECGTNLVSYCNTNIKVLGILDVQVKFNQKTMTLPLYVVHSEKHPLLGREWLNVLPVEWDKVFRSANIVNKISAALPNCATKLNDVLNKYPNVFEDSIGKISKVQATLPLKKNAKPVFLKARKIPFNMQKTVEEELDKLVAEGVFTKVNQSSWATPIVPVKKSHNRVRICGDYKQTVNPSLVIDKHPLPTVDELFASLSGGDKFSKIDLVQAYLQLEVVPEDREILTLSTHRGLYRPNRLMYGVASAPAIWQRQIEGILQGLDGVTVFLDDIKITGPDDETHLRRLEEVLKRLNDRNIRVNKNKCEFFAPEIEYCGYVINRDGIRKMPNKIAAIQEMPPPKNKDEVRSFVGLINYYGRFFANLSSVLYPLNNLLKNDVPFKWSKQCENAFKTVKRQMQSDNCLIHYSPELPLVLATDASPYGVGAVLSHICPDGMERPIQFASQTLTRVQQKYMQVDKEAYAIIFGVKKFFQYLYGRKFILITDNQAITKIFGENKGLPVMSALRMQHYATYLQSFDYQIRFRKSAEHANADAMSRIPLRSTDTKGIMEEADVIELNQIETLPLTAAELAQATAEDFSVRKLIQGLKHGQSVNAGDRFGVEQSEFSLQNGCILRGIRVYVPATLRRRVLDELHSTHFGITRTKSLARGYCWWNGIDRDIEEMISNCADCQSVRSEPTKMRLHCWESPTEPFQRIHVDFAGPFMDTYFFIMVDAYTKWPEIKVCKSTSAENTVNMCREYFSTFGIPAVLVSDHGVQFTSDVFQRFLQMNGIVHKMGAPYHPATNGQAERYVQTFKQKLKSLRCPKSQINLELSNILLTYRKMIHPTTGRSPSMMVFGRQIRSRLDLLLPKNEPRSTKNYAVRTFNDGDRVRVRDFLSKDKWKFGRIAEKVGKLRYAIRLDDGRTWERHVDHIVGVGNELPEAALNIPNANEDAEVYISIPDPGQRRDDTLNTGDDCGESALPSAIEDCCTSEEPMQSPIQTNSNATPRRTTVPNTNTVPVRSTEPLRRSKRIVRPPKKLDL